MAQENTQNHARVNLTGPFPSGLGHQLPQMLGGSAESSARPVLVPWHRHGGSGCSRELQG